MRFRSAAAPPPLSCAILVAAVAVAAFLRFDRLGVPSYWLDEILHQQLTTKAAAEPWWRWLRALHEEHGSLYYLTQLATRMFGTSEAAGRSAAAFFGVLTVPLVWLASRSTRAAAILLAVSPLHVYFSREARAYALVLFLTAALIVILLRARSLAALVATLLALLYTAAVAAPVVASALLVAALLALRSRDRWWWRAVAACAVTLALFPVIYASKPVEDPTWPGFPGLSVALFDELLRSFTAEKIAIALAMLIFAVAGAVAIARKNIEHAIVVVGMTLLPLAGAIASLWIFDHFFAPRYVTPALIGFLLLVAAGIAAIVRWEIAATLVAVAITTQTWAAARHDPFQKLDWRAIAAAIEKHARPGHMVIAAEPWSDISLRHYLDPKIKLVHIFAPEVADLQRSFSPGAWLVTAGYTADPATRHWMCRFPLVLGSPLESFRLHYGSAYVAGIVNFSDGWGDPEGPFRWAIARRATITIPKWGARDEVLRFSVMPAGQQTIRVSLNGHPVAELTPPNGWSEQSIPLPARFWVDGENTIAFDFAHATSIPTDHRTLAAAFQDVRVAPLTRLTALLEKRGKETRLTPLRKEPTVALINRLGFDPNVVWPRLERGELHLDDVLETLTWGAECSTDRQFVDTAVNVLLERPAKPHELRELALLPRDRAIGRIAKWDEFRDRVLAR